MRYQHNKLLFGYFLSLETIALSFAFLGLIATPANAQSFTVQDIHLGMSPEETETTLLAAGYIGTPKRDLQSYKRAGPTFEQNVDAYDAMSFPYSKPVGIRSMSFAKGIPGRKNWVTVGFTELPNGAFLTDVSYKPQDGNVSPDAFASKVREAYGLPDTADTMLDTWAPSRTFRIDGIDYEERLTLLKGDDIRLNITGKMRSDDYGDMVVEAYETRKLAK